MKNKKKLLRSEIPTTTILGKIKKFGGELLIITGLFIFVTNLLNISASGGSFCAKKLDRSRPCTNWQSSPISYYYSSDTRICIAVGIILLVVGIMIIKRRRRT
jgi:hypothetical protein